MSFLLFGGGSCLLFMGLVWLIQPERGRINAYFAAMYVSTGLIVLFSWAERTGFIYRAFPLYNMQIPLCYLFAPLLSYGFSQITELDREPDGLYRPHFIPAAATALAIPAVNLLYAPAFAALGPSASPEDLRSLPAFFAVHLLGLGSNLYILYFLLRMLVSGIRFIRTATADIRNGLRLLLFFVGLFLLDIVLMMSSHLIGSRDLLYAAKLCSALTFIAYAFYSFRYPEYAQKVVRRVKGARYRQTQLRGLNTDALLERLGYLMEAEGLYRRMELSLPALSAELMVTPHQLSEILNRRLGTNFSAYLNRYRVREAERLLVERQDLSVLEIAFEVGFSSKASFNANFFQLTGSTPSDYRKARAPGGGRLGGAAAG